MKKNAPHLPPKACRIDTYYRLQNIRWILLFALLAFIAGVSAALIATTWIMPQYETVSVLDYNNHTVSYNRPDPFLVKQSEQRLYTIYDKRKKTAEKIYSTESFIAQAAIISSDGWAATFVPDYFSGWEKNWEIVDYQNNTFSVKKVIYDDFSGILYFKTEIQGARVMSFPDWKNLQIGSFVWLISSDEWKDTYIKENDKIKTDKSFYVWNDQYKYYLYGSNVSGSVLLDEQGNFLGFLDSNGYVVPGWFVEKQTNNLLSQGVLSYEGVNLKGHIVKIAKENGVNLSGFYLDYSEVASLEVGDVILKINGQNIEADNISQLVWLSPNEFEVVVLRDMVEINFTVNKEKISL